MISSPRCLVRTCEGAAPQYGGYAENATDEGADRVPAGACAEIEHETTMTREPRFARQPLELFDQACFADAGLTAHMHDLTDRRLMAHLQRRGKLAKLRLAVDERAVIGGERT